MKFDYFISTMKKLSEDLFQELVQKALSSPRKRTHYNLHDDLGDPVQRLCVAMEPGSYVRPHRHPYGGSFCLTFFVFAPEVDDPPAKIHELIRGQGTFTLIGSKYHGRSKKTVLETTFFCFI